MTPEEQLEVSTKFGSVKAMGIWTPIFVLLVVALALHTWIAHNDYANLKDLVTTSEAASVTRDDKRDTQLGRLIGIQCAILREQFPQASKPEGCF